VASHLMNHLEANGLLSPLKHSFRERYFCDTQMLLTYNDLAITMDRKQQTYLILLDFSK
ncbi:predicted protein, partial [Nematostella vectensis]